MNCRNLKGLSNSSILRINKLYNVIIMRLVKKSTLYLNNTKFTRNETNTTNNTESLNNDQEVREKNLRLLRKYLENVDIELINAIPKQYVKVTKKPERFYLINHQVAKEFVSLIKDDLLKHATYVIELNPGLGFLTQELLEVGVPFLHLYEKDSRFCEILNKLRDKFPDRFSIENADLFKIARMLYIDAFKDVQQKKWEEPCPLQIIGTISDSKFLRHVILSTMYQSFFMMSGRAAFYVAVSTLLLHKFVASNTLYSSHIMFQTLFNYKVFGTIDSRAYVPWLKHKEIRGPHSPYMIRNPNCRNTFTILKFEPKPDLFKLFNGKEDLLYFLHFTRHHFHKPTNRVIPTLEKIMPGCGFRLIPKGYNIFTQFGDLTANQIYDLFKELKSWPEFENGTFTAGVNEIRNMFDLYTEEDS